MSDPEYEAFLRRKAQGPPNAGFDPIWMPEFLFDFQKSLVEWAIIKGRAALFADCGLGKCPMSLVWAENVVRHTNKPVLILTPLAVSHQVIMEGQKFGIQVERSIDGMAAKNITVTNYERLAKFDPDDYSGVVCDESSILKHWSGATQKSVTRFLSKVPFRLLCTATPSPNDYIEMGTSSEALGNLNYSEMLSTFFRQISDDEKKSRATADDIIHSKRLSWRVIQSFGQWALRPYAFTPFWRWVASWARACRKPSDVGPFDNARFVLPELIRRDHTVEAKTPPPGRLFNVPAFGLNQERAERRRTLNERTELVTELVKDSERAIVWVHLNPEGDRIEKELKSRGAIQVKGSQHMDEKEELILSFLNGESPFLITKAKIAGLGLNLQHCNHVVTFVDHCYDDQTEILTRSGWKSFGCVTTNDDVATINPDTRVFEWQSPSKVIWSPYSGDMIHFCGQRNFDLLVTPNHRLFVHRCEKRFPNGDASWSLKCAKEISNRFRRQEYRMTSVCVPCIGNMPDSVEIPKNGVRSHRNRSLSPIPIDTFLRLAGWYLSEGHARPVPGPHAGQFVISQTEKHPEYRAEIIDVLSSVGLHVNSKTKDIVVYNIDLAAFFIEQFGHGSHNKLIPRWIKDLDPSLLKILRDTMMKGDVAATGCYYKSFSERLRDDFQEICILIGDCRASVHNDYVTIARRNLTPSIHKEPQIVQYDGMIGCVTVPNHTVIVRRNGIPVVSGNSYEKFYQCVRRCYRFGQKNPVTLDVIATEGEVNVRRNMERKERLASQMFDAIIENMNESVQERIQPTTQEMVLPSWI